MLTGLSGPPCHFLSTTVFALLWGCMSIHTVHTSLHGVLINRSQAQPPPTSSTWLAGSNDSDYDHDKGHGHDGGDDEDTKMVVTVARLKMMVTKMMVMMMVMELKVLMKMMLEVMVM